MLLAAWLYFSGFVFRFGGALNAVLHDRGRVHTEPATARAGTGDDGT